MMTVFDDVGVVVIGRNEGDRLRACFESMRCVRSRVYVDSGSTDGSQQLARTCGFEVVELSARIPFTAARARNAGVRRLLDLFPAVEYIQMIDGDCRLAPNWISSARSAIKADTRLAVVFGRRRELRPDTSVYNRMCDVEWDVPVGEARSCGGDALFRRSALQEARGYAESLIAGEEPDLCLRLRQLGWVIKRIPDEMTTHDAAITEFAQWWRRTKRGGHAFAELLHRHASAADPMWRRQVMSITFWAAIGTLSLAVPVGLLADSTVLIAAGTLGAACFLGQMGRLVLMRRAEGAPMGPALWWALLIMIGKFAQVQGVLQFHARRLSGRSSELIEYKSHG